MGKCRSKERKLILTESDNMLISELCEEERLHDEESSYDEKDSHDGEISVLLLVGPYKIFKPNDVSFFLVFCSTSVIVAY